MKLRVDRIIQNRPIGFERRSETLPSGSRLECDLFEGSQNALVPRRCHLHYVDGCWRIAARACSRDASAALCAAAADFSTSGAICFSLATLLLLRCELSALWMACCKAEICPAGKA